MNNEFFDALDLLERERHIPKEYMIEKVEAALAAACKKEYGSANITVVIDPEKRDMRVFRKYKIVAEVEDPSTEMTKEQIEAFEAERKAAGVKHKTRSRKRSVGSDYEYELHTKEFRRLSAQNAKQVIVQAIREAEKSRQLREYEEKKEEVIATAEVKQTFKISKVGTIAGCIVREGKLQRTAKVRVIRDGIVIYTGELGSLKRFKDDVKEVHMGMDCGLNIQGYNDIKVGDVVEAYTIEEIKRTL